MEVSHRLAVIADAHEMAPRMRQEDQDEVRASGGYTPLEALVRSIELSSEAWTTRVDGQIMAVWGFIPYAILLGISIPWLLSTPLVDRYPKVFMRECRKVMVRACADNTILTNMVDARYERALRWVERLGFRVGDPVKFGSSGQEFCPVQIGGTSWVWHR